MTPRLSLESLEARENPAAFGMTESILAISGPPRPISDDVVVDGKIITGQDFDSASRDMPLKGQSILQNSAVVFVGGWGASSYQYSFGGSY